MGMQNNGDGVTQRIFHNGVEVYSQALEFDDRRGFDYSLVIAVSAGDTLDFASDPNGNHDWDSNFFSSVIDTTLLVDLVAKIESLNLQTGVENSLIGRLQAAVNTFRGTDADNDGAGCNAMNGFIDAVEALRGHKISHEAADCIVTDAQSVIELLGCE